MTRGGSPSRTIGQTLERLRRVGLGERMLKTAFAAGLAYWLGLQLPHAQSPFLAPIAAILVMQLTIADSVVSALQRFFGVLLGAPLALVVGAVFGVNPLTIALVVLVAFAIGARLSFNAQGLPQIAVTALLVMLVGAPHVGYALNRIAETAIGGAVGLLVNALVAPPSYLPRAEAKVSAFAEALANGLDRLANDIERGLTIEAADARLEEFRAIAVEGDVDTAIAQAEASLRYNYFHRGAQPAIERWASFGRTLSHTERQARSVVRSIRDLVATVPESPAWLRQGEHGGACSAALRANAAVIRAAVAIVGNPDNSAAVSRFHESVATARSRQANLAGIGVTQPNEASQMSWLALGAVVAGLDRMTEDLAACVTSVGVTSSATIGRPNAPSKKQSAGDERNRDRRAP